MSFVKRFLLVAGLFVVVIVVMVGTIQVLEKIGWESKEQTFSTEESIGGIGNNKDFQSSAINQEAEFRNAVVVNVIFFKDKSKETVIINGMKSPKNLWLSPENITVTIGKKIVNLKSFLEEKKIHLEAGDIVRIFQGDVTYVFVTRFYGGDFHIFKALLEI